MNRSKTNLLILGTFVFSLSMISSFAGSPPEKDRAAILAMAGEFEVTFQFEETVPLQEDYQLTKPYHEDANEIVIVIEDSGDRIVLQHILTTGNGQRVVKHWKQIWTWQDTRLTEFQGLQKWKIRQISPEKAMGKWSQQVTQVDDSPRYESLGKWRHEGGHSRWESGPTNRPLPRREHTKRSDYQVLLGVNRHALTPYGWVHGQDNLKQVLKSSGKVSHYIARERGLNFYDRTTDHDFAVPREYWEAPREFWAKVSRYWERTERDRSEFEILKEVEGESLVRVLFEVARSIRDEGVPIPGEDEIAAMIDPYLK